MQIKMNGIVKTRVLMVCLGNICRSPLAEGIMRELIRKNGLEHLLEVDSAGTAGHCVGNLSDHRSIKVAMDNGIILAHRARQLLKRDFLRFDHILVMDESNLENASRIAGDEFGRSKISIITDYDSRPNRPSIVSDPYWSDISEFEKIYQQLLFCCQGWLSTHFEEAYIG